MKLPPATSLALPLLAACAAVIPDDATPEVGFGAEVADKFVHRGMPQNSEWVAQGHFDVTLPTTWGDSFSLGAFANMDLRNSTGRAWFPDGHAGRFTEFELTAAYSTSLGPVDLTGGVDNYNLPDGEAFPNGPRSSTNELFLQASGEVLGARPEAGVRYDFDQAGGTYGWVGISEVFELGDQLALQLRGTLAYSTASQSTWNYGIGASGFADVHGSAIVTYQVDDHVTLGAHADYSTMLDDDINDWFDLIGIEDTNTWFGVFVDWNY